MALATYVYVDGFNLYYHRLRRTQHRWLDVLKLAKLTLGARYDIVGVKYYTARTSTRLDPQQPARQAVYLRALASLTPVKIYYGKFLSHETSLPLADPPAAGPRWARVIKTEEKGSDVNLACHLVHDAHCGRFQAASVISMDTDLVEPIQIVTQEIGLPVCLIPPVERGSRSLRAVATKVRFFDENRLRRSQLPPSIETPGGLVRKPSTW